jgi:excisionase family DNA binding protein
MDVSAQVMTPPVVGRMVDVSVVAEALGVCESTIYRLVDDEAIPFARVGRAIRFDLAEVLNAVKARA